MDIRPRPGELVWFQDRGYGYVDPISDPIPYDDNYFAEYEKRDTNDVATALNAARVGFVNEFYKDRLIDIGVGAGAFIRARNNVLGSTLTYGYDIMDAAVKMLKEDGLYRDPYEHDFVAACTFWDSLEHIAKPEVLLRKIVMWAFVSMPIYKGARHCRHSKHFKPGEHIHYFTREGLVQYFDNLGFTCLEIEDIECQWREDILSFAFKRRV